MSKYPLLDDLSNHLDESSFTLESPHKAGDPHYVYHFITTQNHNATYYYTANRYIFPNATENMEADLFYCTQKCQYELAAVRANGTVYILSSCDLCNFSYDPVDLPSPFVAMRQYVAKLENIMLNMLPDFYDKLEPEDSLEPSDYDIRRLAFGYLDRKGLLSELSEHVRAPRYDDILLHICCAGVPETEFINLYMDLLTPKFRRKKGYWQAAAEKAKTAVTEVEKIIFKALMDTDGKTVKLTFEKNGSTATEVIETDRFIHKLLSSSQGDFSEWDFQNTKQAHSTFRELGVTYQDRLTVDDVQSISYRGKNIYEKDDNNVEK